MSAAARLHYRPFFLCFFFLVKRKLLFCLFWSISFFFYYLLNDRGCLWDFKFAGDCFSLKDDNRLNFGFSGIYVVLVVGLRVLGFVLFGS